MLPLYSKADPLLGGLWIQIDELTGDGAAMQSAVFRPAENSGEIWVLEDVHTHNGDEASADPDTAAPKAALTRRARDAVGTMKNNILTHNDTLTTSSGTEYINNRFTLEEFPTYNKTHAVTYNSFLRFDIGVDATKMAADKKRTVVWSYRRIK